MVSEFAYFQYRGRPFVPPGRTLLLPPRRGAWVSTVLQGSRHLGEVLHKIHPLRGTYTWTHTAESLTLSQPFALPLIAAPAPAVWNYVAMTHGKHSEIVAAQSQMRQAEQLRDEGDLNGALSAFTETVARFCRSHERDVRRCVAEALVNMGVLSWRAGRMEEALSAYDSVSADSDRE